MGVYEPSWIISLSLLGRTQFALCPVYLNYSNNCFFIDYSVSPVYFLLFINKISAVKLSPISCCHNDMKTWARLGPLLRQWQTKINTRHPLLNKYFPPDKLLLVSWWCIMGKKSCFTAVVRVHCACMCEGIIPFACCLQQLSGILRMAWFFFFSVTEQVNSWEGYEGDAQLDTVSSLSTICGRPLDYFKRTSVCKENHKPSERPLAL